MSDGSLIHNVSRYIALNEEEKAFFSSVLLPMKVRQGDFLEKNGELTKYMINVTSGCLMTYYPDQNGADHVIQFSTSGWWTGDLHSLTKEVPSIYCTKALADSEVHLLTKAELDRLFERVPKFERYFRIIFQNSLVTHQNRLIMNFSATAEERYKQFQEKYPTLEQYVPLKYIASYLGITPEFLSKIRRRLAKS